MYGPNSLASSPIVFLRFVLLRFPSRLRLLCISPLALCLCSFLILRIYINLFISITNRRSLNHLFITRTFFYNRSTVFQNEERANAAVILLNAEKHICPSFFHPECVLLLPGGRVWRQRSSLEIIYPGYDDFECRLANFRIICHSLPVFTENVPKLSIAFKSSEPIELSMTPTDLTPREFVACPGRMFALEQWHLLITALEMHRIHGVELVVAHILSVRDPLFELVRLYQLDGLLTIRSSLRMPSLISTLPYDANSETLWSNQIADFLDCLYEFRESAKFISFPDWDDLLLSGTSHRQFTPIAAILSNLSAMHPNSAVFVPKRFPGSLISLETMSSQNVSLHRLWTDGLRFSPTDPHPCNISKVILRPSMVSSVDLHYAHKLPYEKYEQIAVDSEELHFIEARNYNGEEFTLSSTLGRLVADRMNESFAAFLNRQQIPNSQPILRSLPQFELFLPTIMKCLMQIRSIVQNSARSHCFNVRQCWEVFPPIFDLFREEEGNYCVNVQTNWESFSWVRRSLRVFVNRNSDKTFGFVRGKCIA